MNSGYKVKLWNVNNKGCRLTCLGPTYGNPATKLKLLVKQKSQPRTAIDEPNYFLAYATDRQIVGLMKMPADGNPNKMMGLIAHPGVITDLQVSGDHKFIFTSGGDDLSVNMWFIDPEAVEKQIAIGGQGDEPFENMIDGGKYGKNYKDMKDFFYYSQIRSKKENTTQTRKLEGYVPLDEMGNLMRAMGYYPSEQEIENMKNEVKYSRFTETGQAVSQLGMDTLLKVFVNHRPIYGVEREEI
jgi:WD40 repeat protein